MKNLYIDIECRSGVDLYKSGVYKYSEDKDFKILLFGYSIDMGDVKVIDITTSSLPSDIKKALIDPSVIKWSHSSTFERVCLSRHLNLAPHTYLDPSQWHCSLIWSAYLSLPLSLDSIGCLLHLENQKMKEGKALIKKYCIPDSNGNFKKPHSELFEWDTFIAYNKKDVETELSIIKHLSKYPVPDSVWREYIESETINDRGILVDREFSQKCISLDALSRKELIDRMQELSDIANPNSVSQLRDWLSTKGIETEKLGRKDVEKLLLSVPIEIRPILELRLQLSKSSLKKYKAMECAVCSDNRLRGCFQFYGSHTGRFAGRLVQLQNLRSNTMPHIAETRQIIKTQDYETLKLLYDDIPDTLSQLIRTAFVAKDNTRFIVCDFNAIEARILAWLSGEKWVLSAFNNGDDIYSATAEKMYHTKVEKNGVNKDLRKKGKQATLACGYQGGVGALKAMGAIESGMKEEELPSLVNMWREANPHIVKYWNTCERAIRSAILTKRSVRVGVCTIKCHNKMLEILLPSGRSLYYIQPSIENNKIVYEGVGKQRKWEKLSLYGGTITENITQAIARDVLTYAIHNLSGYNIVAHVHDEVIIEAPYIIKTSDIQGIMERVPGWAKGLPLKAESYETKFYKKD